MVHSCFPAAFRAPCASSLLLTARRVWLGGNRWAPYLAVFYAKSSAQVVLAHPPHRFSTLSGDRQPTLFVAGYNCMIQYFSRFRKANSLGFDLIVTPGFNM